jgi:transposase InsO family protein
MAFRYDPCASSCAPRTATTKVRSSPNLARGFRPTGPNQLWVGDITYIRITAGFVYLAVILDAWSRRVIGYARRVDARKVQTARRFIPVI